MERLIVLGEIPGTHIKITFALWAIGSTSLALLTAFKFGRHILGSDTPASTDQRLQDAA